ncbi:DUF3536 domain-containing protein, partial [bacterium]|nr:DUF3536 domain-containing protein [bacterium]
PRKPYRIFIHDGRYIDVFFYNMELSTGISFEHYLRDAQKLAHKFESYMSNTGSNIIIACTDGESYGHHEHFGDMCLAYFLKRLCVERGYKVANFADFLEKNPPTHEVILKSGDRGEGTSWSCAHGVGRWIRDCGCSTGGMPGWNQAWRGPLRDAFDYLRDTISVIYEDKLGRFFKDVWVARDKYINVMVDYSDKTREKFLRDNCKAMNLLSEDKDLIFSFLEAQKNLLYMYTSCGWFFADVSGIEPVQNMKYALKAISYVSKYTKVKLMENFLQKLEKAKSNLRSPSNGREVFDAYVRASVVPYDDVVANYAMACVLKNSFKHMDVFCYSLDSIYHNTYSYKQGTVYYGEAILKDSVIGEIDKFKYYVFCPSIKKMKTYVVLAEDINENKLFSMSSVKTMEKYLLTLTRGRYYGLSNLILDDTEDLIRIAMKDNIKTIESGLITLFEKSENIVKLFAANNVVLPSTIKSLCKHYYTRKINKKIEVIDEDHLDSILKDISYANKLNFNIDFDRIIDKINEVIEEELDKLSKSPTIKSCEKIISLVNFKNTVNLDLPTYDYEEKIFSMLLDNSLKKNQKLYAKLEELADTLNIVV